MPMRNAAVIALFATLASAMAFGCSCSNGTPIQSTAERYRERAVFTARVVQLMGRTHNWDGKQYSSLALAVVQERYWGLPWYWPKIVLLDGSYPCDMVMTKGEDYLVSGRRGRYGVLQVNLCSRTQPLKTAQLDLRTLDGSQCATPGGTIIGHLLEWTEALQKNLPEPNASVTFHDEKGQAYTAKSDGEGIYELQHLPPGPYNLESQLGQSQYASSNTVDVATGVCTEIPVHLRDYSFSGRVMPGMSKYVKVNLVGVDGQPPEIPTDSIEPDGRFYFRNVPDGEYLLSMTTWVESAGSDFYYPGTYDRQKAARLRVSNHVVGRSIDFNPDLLPLVPIPIALDPPDGSGRFTWRVQLLSSNHVVSEETWTTGGQFVRPYGARGVSYEIGLYGFSNRPTEYGDCWSKALPVTAKSGLSTIHIAIPANCR